MLYMRSRVPYGVDVLSIDFGARVDRGLVRATNQDVARVVPRLGLAFVADGMGGHADGEVASRVAADALEETLARSGGVGARAGETVKNLSRAFSEANRRVGAHRAAEHGLGRLGTTLVASAFGEGYAIVAWIGDSRCYRLRAGTLELLTEDHSMAAEIERSGAGRAGDPPMLAGALSHVLTRCLNGDEPLRVETKQVGCAPGDVFLLCSDGLWGAVEEERLAEILASASTAEGACQALIGAAWSGGGLDNIGVAVARHLAATRADKPWFDADRRGGRQGR